MSGNTSDFKGGSIEKIDNCFYLKLSRSPNVNENPKTKEIVINQEENRKKESIFAGDSIISNEEYKIIKVNNDNLNNKIKNGNISNISNSCANLENNPNKNLKNQVNSNINSNNSNKFIKKSIYNNNKSKNSDDISKYTKIRIVDKKIYKRNDLESEFFKDYKSRKEGDLILSYILILFHLLSFFFNFKDTYLL